jgi:mevalonate kinase
MNVTVSAPGKINIMGEHAVVYGKPSLLAAIDKRLRVTISPGVSGITIHTKDKEVKEFMEYALTIVQKEYKIDGFPPMSIDVISDIPFGYHLGSSASLAVATVGACVYFVKKLWNPMEINRLAYEAEKKQHGNPSGGDNTAVCFGGFLWYRRELEFLRSIWQLPFRPKENVSHFFLINTGKPEETTREMVAMVASRVKSQESSMERIFSENEKQTRRISVALKEGLEHDVVDAMIKGERTLEEMGVVSKKVQPVIRAIEKEGGAAKILGGGGMAGGVGFLLCYHHDPDHIATICQPYGYAIEPVILGEEGVRLEK